MTFAETAEKIFEYGPPWAKRYSNAAKVFIDYGLMATYYSAGCVYIVFIANTFHDVFNAIFGWNMTVRVYILMIMVPVIMMGQFRSLKFLVPFSGSANLFIVITFGIVLFYIFNGTFDLSDRPLIVSWTRWPVFFR